MEKFKDIRNLIIIILFAIIWLQRSCTSPVNKYIFNKSKNDTIITHDTTWAKDTVYSYKIKYQKVIDSFPVANIIKQLPDTGENPCDYIRVYNGLVDDTNITINVEDTVRGLIIGSQLHYKLKVPIKIETKETIKIKPKNILSLGLELGGNSNQLNFSPLITLNHNKTYYSIRYDIVNKTYNFGIGWKIYQK